MNQARQRTSWTNSTTIRNADCRAWQGFASPADRPDPHAFGVANGMRWPYPQPGAKWAQSKTKVADLLGEEDVVLGLPAKGKRSALARIAHSLGEKAGTGQGPVLAAMLRRERLGSTGIGHGVAVPHARLEGLLAPQAMFATLQHPVWFDAPDTDPVDLLLAILWPKSDDVRFLSALAYFCRLLRHPEFRDRIRVSDTPAEALAWMEYFEERAAEPLGGRSTGCGSSGIWLAADSRFCA